MTQNSPDVRYLYSHTAMPSLEAEVLLLMRSGGTRVCDVGGGANPVGTMAEIKRFGIEYLVLDASAEELEKAPSEYDTLAVDVEDTAALDRLVTERGPFDSW
ncbi:MAG: hypothetical protein JOZ95_23675 [Solirubrobacterales bacterium]|nr:hypothetical protein [Solirubrobacterales bacterium]